MPRKKNNIDSLLSSLKDTKSDVKDNSSSETELKVTTKAGSNPAIEMGAGVNVKRAASVRQAVLQLKHDQVKLFKYHDRSNSSLDSIKVTQIRRSIEAEGQHFPGIVRKTSETTADGRMVYELVVGRLRYEASRGVGVFKAFLKELTDSEAAKIMFSENEDRLDITPFERWLSILPIIKDKIMGVREIAELTGFDAGNLSKALKAQKVYEECNLHMFLENVSKVKLGTLIEVQNLYDEKPKEVIEAIKTVEFNYAGRKDNLFLKSIIKIVKDIKTNDRETIFLSGSKVNIKKVGENVTLSFKGLPQENEFSKIIEKLKELNALQ